MALHETKVLIIGSGAAGYTAAIYAARANLSPIVVTGMQPGGQLTITTDVENYPGFAKAVQGPYLMEQMRLQAENVGAKIIEDEVKGVECIDGGKYKFKSSSYGNEYLSSTLIIATGAEAKWLGIESEEKFKGYGVSACATCDGAFFKKQKVAVIGGGNTAVEEALFLTNHASEVVLIHRRDQLRAEEVMQGRLFNNPKIKVIWDHVVEEIVGEENPKRVTAMVLKSVRNQELKKIEIDGIFIAIGHAPNTHIFKNLVKIDDAGYIVTQLGTTITSKAGVFAAGDVQDKVYRQAVVAAGSGCMAALDAERFIRDKTTE
ncbi:thioredoxin-disulfide reductase [Candidatus Mesenet endosymbiont of Phosphuga atrata]|uniref:thioredoxin-disulfide reductase n=1 Tax=Candidatus Mesenet endosymbiont of Phosphuga atrata TaxID=3066221 RepID=UPI0030D1DD78